MRQENGSVRKLQELLDDKIVTVEGVIRKGLESAPTGYYRFFGRKAAYLYKGGLPRGHHRLLCDRVDKTDDVENLRKCFGDITRHHEERLASGRLMGSGVHPMVDTCRTPSLECSRQMLRDYLEFSRPPSTGRPEQDVKEENGQPMKYRTNGLRR